MVARRTAPLFVAYKSGKEGNSISGGSSVIQVTFVAKAPPPPPSSHFILCSGFISSKTQSHLEIEQEKGERGKNNPEK